MPIHNPGGTLQSGAVQVQEAHCKVGTGPGGTLQSKVQVQEVHCKVVQVQETHCKAGAGGK